MSDTMRVDLKKGVGSNLLHSNGGRRRQESCVLHFFDRFSDGKDEGTIYEGQDDVRIEWI
jgi:hypothetical protein